MFDKNLAKLFLISLAAFVAVGCSRSPFVRQTVAPATLRDVPALKLNFRFEADVPAPAAQANQQTNAEEKNAAVQNDFDTNRPQEILEKTFTSPDKQRVLAVYRKVEDLSVDFRLDIYNGADGKLLRKVTPNGMAVRFPDTIVWSPDSNSIAFVGVARTAAPAAATTNPAEATATTPPAVATETNANTNADANSQPDANANANGAPTTVEPANTADQPKAVLTFRTEQIYVCSREGVDLKPLTQNEGLIYFYFVWSPDSAALASLASTWREWQVGQVQAKQRGEIFTPAGRPRLVERNGRERRLDDSVTTVQPVWSPDSAKVALAFDKEIRVYDAIGDSPTQAAIPLRNPLLISSKAYDDQKKRETEGQNPVANTNANANANAQSTPTPTAPTDTSTLPDENSLVSFNPVIDLQWTEANLLYLRTGYVREMENSADSVHSYMRWHRLALSPQAVSL